MKKRILIMAGGTGGHVFPALAVANWLQAHYEIDVHWLGTQKGLESDVIPRAQIPISYLEIHAIDRSNIKSWFLVPFKLFKAVRAAVEIIKQFNPDVVLGMGGFASGPGGIAAWILGKPLVIHEQNSIPGLTNRSLSYLASRVLEAFPNAFPKRRHAICSGNPLRDNLFDVQSPRERKVGSSERLKILVLGGSGGALALNKLIPQALALIPEKTRPEVWHQSGKKHYEITAACYQQQNLTTPVRVSDFIENMREAYLYADLVICRAGALTIAELTAVGLGSILIPYPYAAADHQTRNAEFLVEAQAAYMIPEKQLTAERLAKTIEKFIADRALCLNMAEFAGKLSQADATKTVALQCMEVALV